MKIKLDENLPLQIAAWLALLGHDVHTIYDEDLVGAQDARIWAAAQEEGRFLITQDLDFADLRRFAPGTHQGILLVRLHSPNRKKFDQQNPGIISHRRSGQVARVLCSCNTA